LFLPQKNPRAAGAARGFLFVGSMIREAGFNSAMLPSRRPDSSRNRRSGDLHGAENGQPKAPRASLQAAPALNVPK
ncbi:hypothetical protein, partial [Achromobacter xylosoxidans]|uniref:hypothetical protein n=1 Tax=Alcaligenes xylosoxydans xylosoxydans TaxID=85698 RepID=UPI001EEF515C